MPVGATLGAAAIGGAATLSASAKASKAAKNAAAANNAMLQAQQDRAYQTIDPYLQTGYQANDALSRIVLGPNASAKPAGGYAGSSPNPMSGSTAGGTDWGAYLQTNPDAAQWVAAKAQQPDGAGKSPQELAAWHYQLDGSRRELTTTAPVAPQQPMAATSYGPQVAPRPVMSRPAAPTLDVGLGSYEKSPDYEWQLSEGTRNVMANQGALGRLESGDALKSLQTFGQNLALGDYDKWRSYTTGQRNFEAARGDQNFNVDSARSDAQFDSDRGYTTQRFDKQISDLFNLSGQGMNAAGTAIGVGQSGANAMSANTNSAAQAQGNAALFGAGQVNQMIGGALNLYGRMNGAGGPLQTPQYPGVYTGNNYGDISSVQGLY